MVIDNNTVRRLLERALDIPADSLESVELIADLPNWDSLTLVTFIAIVDEECGKTIRGTDVQDALTLDDLARLIES